MSVGGVGGKKPGYIPESKPPDPGLTGCSDVAPPQQKGSKGWTCEPGTPRKAAPADHSVVPQAPDPKDVSASALANQLRALPQPYTGDLKPESLAKEFVARTAGKTGTDHRFVNLALQAAHSQGEMGQLNSEVQKALGADPSNWKALSNAQKEKGPNGALKSLINDELSGLKHKQAMDCLTEGKINHATDGKLASMVDGADDAITGMFDMVKDHPYATAGIVVGGAAAVLTAPVWAPAAAVVGAVAAATPALATLGAGAAVYKVGSAGLDLATAKTTEETNKAYHDLGGGSVDGVLAAASGGAAIKGAKQLMNYVGGAAKAAKAAKAGEAAVEVVDSAKTVAQAQPKVAPPSTAAAKGPPAPSNSTNAAATRTQPPANTSSSVGQSGSGTPNPPTPQADVLKPTAGAGNTPTASVNAQPTLTQPSTATAPKSPPPQQPANNTSPSAGQPGSGTPNAPTAQADVNPTAGAGNPPTASTNAPPTPTQSSTTTAPKSPQPAQQSAAKTDQPQSGSSAPVSPPAPVVPNWESQLTEVEGVFTTRANGAKQLAQTPTANMSPNELKAHVERLNTEAREMGNGVKWVEARRAPLATLKEEGKATADQVATAVQRLDQMTVTAQDAKASLELKLAQLATDVSKQPTLGEASQTLKAAVDGEWKIAKQAKVDVSKLTPEELVQHRAQLGSALETAEAQLTTFKKVLRGADPKDLKAVAPDARTAQNDAEELVATLKKGVEASAKQVNDGLVATAQKASHEAYSVLGQLGGKELQSLPRIEEKIAKLENTLHNLKDPDRGARSTAQANDAVNQARGQVQDALNRLEAAKAAALAVAKKAEANAPALKAAREEFLAGQAATAATKQAARDVVLKAAQPVADLKKELLNAVSHAQAELTNFPSTAPAEILQTARTNIARAARNLEREFTKLASDTPEVKQALSAELERAQVEINRASNAIGDLEVGNRIPRAEPRHVLPDAPRAPLNEHQAAQLLRTLPPKTQQDILAKLRGSGRVTVGLTPQDVVRARELGMI